MVASEVRSLAGRSAEAAREIKSLIATSVEQVDNGTRVVQEAWSRALRGFSSLTSVVAASVRQAGWAAQLALGTDCDAGWVRVGARRARWLTSISSLSAAGFQEMRPARAPA